VPTGTTERLQRALSAAKGKRVRERLKI